MWKFSRILASIFFVITHFLYICMALSRLSVVLDICYGNLGWDLLGFLPDNGVDFFLTGVHNTLAPGHLFCGLVAFVGVRHLGNDGILGSDPSSGWSCADRWGWS